MPNTLTKKLWDTGLKLLDIDLENQQVSLLKQYIDLLTRWNKTYNLTAVREPTDMIPLHIFDSLAVAKFISGKTCLDVGSGAGLPTIPLAIMQADREFTALDTNGKKTRFIQQAVIDLGLKNVQVKQVRIEHLAADEQYDAIISRAFSSIADFIQPSSKHLAKNGVLYAMKGLYPEDEMKQLNQDFELSQCHKLNVPYVEGERHVLEIIRRS